MQQAHPKASAALDLDVQMARADWMFRPPSPSLCSSPPRHLLAAGVVLPRPDQAAPASHGTRTAGGRHVLTTASGPRNAHFTPARLSQPLCATSVAYGNAERRGCGAAASVLALRVLHHVVAYHGAS